MVYAVTEPAPAHVVDERPAPMDVEEEASPSSSPALFGEDPTRAIVFAAYRGDAERVKFVLRHCAPGTVANMSLTRAAAVELLGQNVYLGSHSWSTQEGFPVMYFAGE